LCALRPHSRHHEDGELQLYGTLGLEPEEGAFRARRDRCDCLWGLDISAGKNTHDSYGPQEWRLNATLNRRFNEATSKNGKGNPSYARQPGRGPWFSLRSGDRVVAG